MEVTNKDNQEKNMKKLESYLKRYRFFHTRYKTMQLMDKIVNMDRRAKLPIRLRSVNRDLLSFLCSRIVVNNSLKEERVRAKEKVHTYNKPIKFQFVATIGAVFLTTILNIHTVYTAYARKSSSENSKAPTIKTMEMNIDSLNQNDFDHYTLNKQPKDGKNITSNQVRAATKEKKDLDSKVSSEGAITSVSTSSISGISSGASIIDSDSQKVISDDDTKKNTANTETTTKKKAKKREERRSVYTEKEETSVHNTEELLALYNKNIKGKKLTKKDLKILSQCDQDLMIIKSRDGEYNQATRSSYVAITENSNIQMIYSPTIAEKDYLTGKEINKKSNYVDFIKVSDYIENNDIKKVGYQLSSNTFWGSNSISKVYDLYGAEVVECIQKYGLPVPTYEAKDFYQANKKAEGQIKKVKK